MWLQQKESVELVSEPAGLQTGTRHGSAAELLSECFVEYASGVGCALVER